MFIFKKKKAVGGRGRSESHAAVCNNQVYRKAFSVCHLFFSPHGEVRELKTEELKSSLHTGQRMWLEVDAVEPTKSPSTKYVHIKPVITQGGKSKK